MAASATDIISVARIKDELRIPAGTDSQDTLLESQIEAAVSYVSHPLRGPLVDRSETYYLPPIRGEGPLIFASPLMKSLTEIKYWTPTGALRLDPDGTIARSDLGRLHVERYDWQTHEVFPPVGGWPETLADSLIELTVVRGMDITPETVALRSAVILCVRQLYDGYRQIRPTEAFLQIVKTVSQPWLSRTRRAAESKPSIDVSGCTGPENIKELVTGRSGQG